MIPILSNSTFETVFGTLPNAQGCLCAEESLVTDTQVSKQKIKRKKADYSVNGMIGFFVFEGLENALGA